MGCKVVGYYRRKKVVCEDVKLVWLLSLFKRVIEWRLKEVLEKFWGVWEESFFVMRFLVWYLVIFFNIFIFR